MWDASTGLLLARLAENIWPETAIAFTKPADSVLLYSKSKEWLARPNMRSIPVFSSHESVWESLRRL